MVSPQTGKTRQSTLSVSLNDLVAFSQLEEPSLRAKMCRWAEFENAADAHVKPVEEESSSSPQPDPFKFPLPGGGDREDRAPLPVLFWRVSLAALSSREQGVTSQCVSIRLGLMAIGRQACGEE